MTRKLADIIYRVLFSSKVNAKTCYICIRGQFGPQHIWMGKSLCILFSHTIPPHSTEKLAPSYITIDNCEQKPPSWRENSPILYTAYYFQVKSTSRRIIFAQGVNLVHNTFAWENLEMLHCSSFWTAQFAQCSQALSTHWDITVACLVWVSGPKSVFLTPHGGLCRNSQNLPQGQDDLTLTGFSSLQTISSTKPLT